MKGLPRSLAHAKPGTEPGPRRVRYDLRDLSVTVTAGASTAKGLGTAVLGDLPEGNVLFLGAISYLQFESSDTDVSATWDGDYSVGTTASADTTLDSTDADIITSAAIGAATAKLSPVARGEGDTLNMFNNTDGSLELNLNFTTDDDAVTDSQTAIFLVNGYVELCYMVMGDD